MHEVGSPSRLRAKARHTRRALRAHPRWRWFALVVLATGMMLSVVNVTIVNIALPDIAEEFGSDVSAVGWTVSGFLVTQATLLLLAGRAGDLYGRRRIFVIGVIIVMVGSVLAAIAWDTASLISFRILQGIGACAMAPTAIGGVTELFPGAQRGQAMGVLAGVIGIAPVLALNVAGALVGWFGWRSVFWFSVPIGVLVLAGAALVLPASAPRRRGERFDIVGAALVATGLFSLLLALSRAEAWGWTAPATLATGALGIVGLGAFLGWEGRTPQPMLHLDLFRLRSLSSANACSFLSSVALFGSTILLPFYFSKVLGYGPARLGLAITPIALAFVVAAPIAGRLVPRLGPGRIAGAGFLLSAVGSLALALAMPTQRYAAMLPGIVLLALGLASAIAPINTTAVHDVPGHRLGVAASLPNICRYTGGALGSAVMLAVLHAHIPEGATRTAGRAGDLWRELIAEGSKAAMLVPVLTLALAALASLAMPRRLVQPAGPTH